MSGGGRFSSESVDSVLEKPTDFDKRVPFPERPRTDGLQALAHCLGWSALELKVISKLPDPNRLSTIVSYMIDRADYSATIPKRRPSSELRERYISGGEMEQRW